MRILTRPEIHAADPDMVRTMAFHDRLVHSRLLTLLPESSSAPMRLAFDNQVTITPLLDPMSTRSSAWALVDQKGGTFPWLDLPDLIGCPVTGIGYFQHPEWEEQVAAPYLQFINRIYLVCETLNGGCALRHDRPREDSWDIFPQFPIS